MGGAIKIGVKRAVLELQRHAASLLSRRHRARRSSKKIKAGGRRCRYISSFHTVSIYRLEQPRRSRAVIEAKLPALHSDCHFRVVFHMLAHFAGFRQKQPLSGGAREAIYRLGKACGFCNTFRREGFG